LLTEWRRTPPTEREDLPAEPGAANFWIIAEFKAAQLPSTETVSLRGILQKWQR
jgi:hypothetical protein